MTGNMSFFSSEWHCFYSKKNENISVFIFFILY